MKELQIALKEAMANAEYLEDHAMGKDDLLDAMNEVKAIDKKLKSLEGTKNEDR